jgi:hypothetical protein
MGWATCEYCQTSYDCPYHVTETNNGSSNHDSWSELERLAGEIKEMSAFTSYMNKNIQHIHDIKFYKNNPILDKFRNAGKNGNSSYNVPCLNDKSYYDNLCSITSPLDMNFYHATSENNHVMERNLENTNEKIGDSMLNLPSSNDIPVVVNEVNSITASLDVQFQHANYENYHDHNENVISKLEEVEDEMPSLHNELKEVSPDLSQIIHVGSQNHDFECGPRSCLDKESDVSAILRSGLQTTQEENKQKEEIIQENELKSDDNNINDLIVEKSNENSLNSDVNIEDQKLNQEENEINNDLQEQEEGLIEDETHLHDEFGKLIENNDKLPQEIEKENISKENIIEFIENEEKENETSKILFPPSHPFNIEEPHSSDNEDELIEFNQINEEVELGEQIENEILFFEKLTLDLEQKVEENINLEKTTQITYHNIQEKQEDKEVGPFNYEINDFNYEIQEELRSNQFQSEVKKLDNNIENMEKHSQDEQTFNNIEEPLELLTPYVHDNLRILNQGVGVCINVEIENKRIGLHDNCIHYDTMNNEFDYFNGIPKLFDHGCIAYSFHDPFVDIPSCDEHIRYISSKHKRKKKIPEVICNVALNSKLFIGKLPRSFNDSCKSFILKIIENLCF